VALVDRDKASLEEVAKSLPADQVMVQATDVSDRVPSIEWSRLSSTAWAGWTSS
jgi:NADP-dependent 3-hydroxy acid dehydrogenase YdfG